jgi:hypothetical protein
VVAQMKLLTIRPKVWHLLLAIAVSALGLWGTDLASRWENHRQRVRGLEFQERMYLSQADFLVKDVPGLRDRPRIETEEGWHKYHEERIAERGFLDLHINPDDWAAAFDRSDAANRVKAAELRALAAQAAQRRRDSWWRYWAPVTPPGTPTRSPGS